jgi:hypothetical protein
MFDAPIYIDLRDNAPATRLGTPTCAQRAAAQINTLSLAERRCMP